MFRGMEVFTASLADVKGGAWGVWNVLLADYALCEVRGVICLCAKLCCTKDELNTGQRVFGQWPVNY